MVKKWINDDSGQALSEYGLVLALVAVAAIAAVTIFGDKIAAVFTSAANKLPTP